MKVILKEEKKRQNPDFGGKRIGEIDPSGDTERDFHNAMVALRDDNYEAFIDDLNTLATDQKVKNLRDAIIDKFNSPDGVSVQFSNPTSLEIRNIHPTQFEVDMEKSLAFPLKTKPEGIDQAFSKQPICIKNTPLVVAEVDGVNYIIDGHHRWSQVYCMNPNAQMVVRVIKSNMFKDADDVLKLVQMQLFIAKDGGELPQATVDSEYNLYTIDENTFKNWCENTITDHAKQIFAKHIKGNPIDYLWNNVLVMRKEAQPTPNAHGRGDMPQTDQVDGEYMKPKATPVSEKTIERPTRGHKEMKNEKKEVFTLQVEREDENGEFEVFDAMKYAKTYYSFDDAMEDAKKAYDEYSAIEDRPIEVCITAGEYEMPNGDIYGEPDVIECINAENRGKFDESTKRKTSMTKLNMTKERFEKSHYFQKKYGKLEYVSESGNLYKTSKGKVLKFAKESVDAPKDVARTCPVCGSHDCEFDDSDIRPSDYTNGGEVTAQFYCNECASTYAVTFKLTVTDVTPSGEEENQEIDLPDSELEDYDL